MRKGHFDYEMRYSKKLVYFYFTLFRKITEAKMEPIQKL